MLEPSANVRIVDRERRRVAETLGEKELLVRERGVLADAIDVERPLETPAGDERHGDEGLWLDRCAGNETHSGIEMRLVREHGLAVVDRPARDPLPERERLAEHLVGPLAASEHGVKLALRLVGLVDVDVL